MIGVLNSNLHVEEAFEEAEDFMWIKIGKIRLHMSPQVIVLKIFKKD